MASLDTTHSDLGIRDRWSSSGLRTVCQIMVAQPLAGAAPCTLRVAPRSARDPLQTFDGPRLLLRVDQPSSGVPLACQTGIKRYGAYAGDAARRSRSPTISTKPGISTGERHLVLVAGKPRRLPPNFWRLFTFLYQHRGDVVDDDRIRAELYNAMEQPVAANAVRENMRRLRKALAESRYEIINHPTLGYELIVTEVPARRRRRACKLANASEALSSVDATSSIGS